MTANKIPQDLLIAAKTAWQNAYAPYSKFQVGAALRSSSGVIYSGANVENAAYGLTRCAEQSAIQAMASAGERQFTEIVIYTTATDPATPCGACRQILHEFAADATVFIANAQGVKYIFRVSELLPGAFTAKRLPV